MQKDGNRYYQGLQNNTLKQQNDTPKGKKLNSTKLLHLAKGMHWKLKQNREPLSSRIIVPVLHQLNGIKMTQILIEILVFLWIIFRSKLEMEAKQRTSSGIIVPVLHWLNGI